MGPINTFTGEIVTVVGGKNPGEIASAVDVVEAATTAATPDTLVLRGAAAEFSAAAVTATTLNGVDATATSAPDADTIVLRDPEGLLLDRATPPGLLFPDVRDFVARSGIVPSWYKAGPAQISASVKSDYAGTDPAFGVLVSPTFDYSVNGKRGILMDQDGDSLGVSAFEPGTASFLDAHAFCVPADPAAARSLFGKTSTDAGKLFYAQLTAAGKVSTYIEDGDGHGDSNAGGADQGPISFGLAHIYLYIRRLDRRAAAYPAGNALRTRLVKWGVGLVGAQYAKDITLVITLTGGTSPTYNIGGMPGIQNGAGVIWLGGLVATGAQIEVDGIEQAISEALGAE